MRFAAAQIPAKIGVHSLNGENLHRFTQFRAASNSSPFFTLIHIDFFTPPFARRRLSVLSPILPGAKAPPKAPYFSEIFPNPPFPKTAHFGPFVVSPPKPTCFMLKYYTLTY